MKTLIDPELLVRLCCPRCHLPVSEDVAGSALVCEAGHRYPVVDGIPDMVIDT